MLAKRKTKARMRTRTYKCSLDFEVVRATYRAVAEETEPLRGILTKGQRPIYYVEHDRPMVQFTQSSPGVPVKKPMWSCALLAAEPGFSLTITQAWTHNDEIGGL